MTNILVAFNDHFIEFLNDIHNVFPQDPDILTAKNALTAIRKANPKMIIKIWHTYICLKYNNEIENGNIDFFINKDYSNDIADTESSDQIMQAINRLRNPIREMDENNQLKVMKYIQNLTKLANIYSSTF